MYSRPPFKDIHHKSKITAAVLAWFLGWLGIHRLYIGKKSTGIIMLVSGIIDLIAAFFSGWSPFVTILTLGLGIWATIDFITIICGAMIDGKGNPVKD